MMSYLDLISRKILFLPKGWLSIGIGCPGKWWNRVEVFKRRGDVAFGEWFSRGLNSALMFGPDLQDLFQTEGFCDSLLRKYKTPRQQLLSSPREIRL